VPAAGPIFCALSSRERSSQKSTPKAWQFFRAKQANRDADPRIVKNPHFTAGKN
jgi:hypothetical protein